MFWVWLDIEKSGKSCGGDMQKKFLAPAGFFGRQFARELIRSGEVIDGFLDNNPALVGTKILGLPVHGLSDARSLGADALYLVGPDQLTLQKQLEGIGLPGNVVRLISKATSTPPQRAMQDRSRLISELVNSVASRMEHAQLMFWAMNSFLLAIKRQGDASLFSDLDVFFWSDDYSRVLETFGTTEFCVQEMKVGKHAKIVVRFPPSDPMLCEPAIADFKPISRRGKTVVSDVEGRIFPAKWFDEPIFLKFGTTPIPCPSAADEIVATLYGPDWQREAATWNSQHATHKNRAAEKFPYL